MAVLSFDIIFASNLKQLIIIMLLAGTLGQTFSWLFIVAGYELNKEYIAANLCENKARPKLKCNGKCQMMKKMQQEEKKDQENPERKSENKSEIVSFHFADILIVPVYQITIIKYIQTNTGCPVDIAAAIFHPPSVLG